MSVNNIYPFSALTGGTDDSYLDYFDGNDLVDGDMAFGIVGNARYDYILNAASGASENSPFRIQPDTNPGTKVWHLVGTTARIGAMISLSSDIIISNAITQVISWATENYDDAGFWEGITNPSRFTIPTGITGVRLGMNTRWEINATGIRTIGVYKNAAEFIGFPKSTSSGASSVYCNAVSMVIPVSASNYFEATAYQDSGGDLDIVADNETWFSIEAVTYA